jgi:uncharacterized membrane protein
MKKLKELWDYLCWIKSKAGVTALGGLQGFVMALVVIGITLTIGIYVVDEVESKMDAGSEAESAANETIHALGDISEWFAIIVIVVVAVIIIGLIMGAFQRRR